VIVIALGAVVYSVAAAVVDVAVVAGRANSHAVVIPNAQFSCKALDPLLPPPPHAVKPNADITPEIATIPIRFMFTLHLESMTVEGRKTFLSDYRQTVSGPIVQMLYERSKNL
jgi:hypothetical protein